MQSPADRFCSAVVSHLSRLEADLVSVLRSVINYPYPPEVERLHFEIFCDGFTEGFPVRLFFLDSDANEYFVYENGRASYPCTIDPGLLQITEVYPFEVEEQIAAEEPDLDFYTLAGEALVPWFARCWSEAGGERCSRAASIALHDDARAFDLVAGAWSNG